MPDANPLAPLALILWAPLALVLFAYLRPALAASLSIVGATILLPSGYAFDTKGLPAIDREVVAVGSALLGCALYARGRLGWPRRGFGVDGLALAMIAGGFLTAYTNGDAFWMGDKHLPGMPLWGGVSRAAETILAFWLPLYLGRSLFRSPADLRVLLLVLAVAGALYALPALWESRMSPQLHKGLYGYMPADFAQARRPTGWGWRPMVFVGHGLALARLLAICAVALALLWRVRARIRGVLVGYAFPWVYFVLVMCQSFAAAVYATIIAPIVAFAPLRWNRLLLAGLVAIVFTYPTLRAADLFPTEQFVSAARLYHEGRAQSLTFRFTNEDLLLERAQERPWFGWGGHGRERIYDERGRSETVSDGYWIIIMGQTGLVGFVCVFGMILLPVVAAVRALRGRSASTEALLVMGMAWVIVITAIDLLPNGFLATRTLFCGGALLGAVGGWRRSRMRRARPPRQLGPTRPESDRSRPGTAQDPRERDAAAGRLGRERLPR